MIKPQAIATKPTLVMMTPRTEKRGDDEKAVIEKP
jgi:hypothetical protein